MRLFSNISNLYQKIVTEDDDEKELNSERFGETITPNMRALRLSMTVADYLLSMNIPASDVAAMALTITDRYCQRKVAIEIIASVLMFSQYRGDDREPLTLIHAITPRTVNSSLIQSIQEIVDEIHDGELSLDDAEVKLEKILEKPKTYPQWVLSIGSASISAGVAALLSASLQIVAMSFLAGGLISFVLLALAKHRIPTFFAQVAAAAIATLVAAGVTWLGGHGVGIFVGVDPNLIIIGGIIMLVSGLAFVGSFEDAIDEYYLTASSRILQVVMLTAGIVVGIVVGLYIAKYLGISMSVNTDKRLSDTVGWQYVGVAMLAAGYSLSVNSRVSGILLAVLISVGGWAIYAATAPIFSPIAASFIAAAAVGASAALIARWLRIPSVTLTTAGIIALVPGLTLFNGLMAAVVGANDNTPSLDAGVLILSNALFLAISIAAGATFGNLVARPLRRTLIRAQNALPRRKLN